jgi:large subunit ribosomal protein L24e
LSEYRIYPGHGKLFIRRDAKPVWLGSSKAYSLTLQRKKPLKLTWTQAWRRLHKKGLAETQAKKRNRRTTKVARAVVGLALEDIQSKASTKPEVRTAQREAALKEVKARKEANKAKSDKKDVRSMAAGAGQKTKIPKNVMRVMRGTTTR